ncbi:MAG TPA: CBS domain-containing protein [Gaiellaceae bacterium]|nr:CBS domain-containing protein [Gaiellaceae bacterium]
MSSLHDIELIPASVDVSATFDDAARALAESRLPALAVLDEGHVVGLFTDEELLLGVSPKYLDELRHTAFLESELPSLRERAAAVRSEPVRKHMRKPITVELDSSSLHASERFVHCDEGAIAVVDDDGRFVGMLSRAEFAYAMLRRLTES